MFLPLLSYYSCTCCILSDISLFIIFEKSCQLPTEAENDIDIRAWAISLHSLLPDVEKACASQTTSCLLKLWSPFTLKSHPCILAVNIFNETAEGQGAAMFFTSTFTWKRDLQPSTTELLPPLSFLRPCITVTGCAPPDEVLHAA